MSKRFTLVVGALVSMATLLAACTSGGNTEGNPPDEQPGLEGEAQVSVKGLAAWEIQSMVVTAQPANISKALAYSADAGTFTGTLVLPTGTQTLTANGYAYVSTSDGGTPDGGPFVDAGSSSLTLVATGSATANIVANTTTAVSMRIYDQTPPDPQPDIAPIIRSLTASSVSPQVNQAITLTVTASDLDGDTLSYLWSSDCIASSFSNRTSATTSWTATTQGACTLSVAVTARGRTVSDSVSVTVFTSGPDGGTTGGAQVNGQYIARPEIYAMAIYGDIPFTVVYRYEPTANLPNVSPNSTYSLEFPIDYGTTVGARSSNMTVTCGSLVKNYDSCDFSPSCYSNYTWYTPPADAGRVACKVTASATNETLTDSFSAGVLVR